MKLQRLLRGRVAIRPLPETTSSILVLPDQAPEYDRKRQHLLGIKAKSSHWAVVLGMGPPAIGLHGHEVPHGYNVGDTVNFTYQMHENWSDGQVWEDGLPCMFVAQEHIQAVLE